LPDPHPDAASRAYWNQRIDDTVLSDDAPGTPGFFAARAAYRYGKNPYLDAVVGFEAWRACDVLDVGCGSGVDLVRLARGGARVTGVDVAPAAVALARAAAAAAGVAANVIEADGANLPFADASFDLVLCHGVLSFMRDPALAVAEVHRVVRPGGRAILMVYNRRSWMHWLLRMPGRLVDPGHSDAPGFRTWTRPEFERLLTVFADIDLRVERPLPVPRAVRSVAGRALRPFGWHLVAIARK
jgi:SAM-dependent methyltransferase